MTFAEFLSKTNLKLTHRSSTSGDVYEVYSNESLLFRVDYYWVEEGDGKEIFFLKHAKTLETLTTRLENSFDFSDWYTYLTNNSFV